MKYRVWFLFLLPFVCVFGIAHSVLAAPKIVSLATNDIIYDPGTQQIYVSVPSSDTTGRANTITAIDPNTGIIGLSIPVGPNPSKLARSDDNQFLYASLTGTNAIRQVNLTTQTAGSLIVLGSDPTYSARDIAVLPGNPSAIAVARYAGGHSNGVAIYDGTTMRPVAVNSIYVASVIENGSSAAELFGYNGETSSFGFERFLVSGSGVTLVDSAGGLISGFGMDIKYDKGLIYATSGAVVDPNSKKVLGTLPEYGCPVCPDSARHRVYYLEPNDTKATIKAYDIDTLSLVTTLSVNGANGGATSLIRCAGNKIAFRTVNNQIVIVDDSTLVPNPFILVGVPSTVTEGAGVLAGAATVSIPSVQPSDAVITLLSSNPSAVVAPATATILAGQLSITFDITVPDDAILAGTQTAIITGSLQGMSSGTAAILVNENDLSSLSISLPTSANEGGVVTGTVSMAGVAGKNVSVALLSSTSDATAPVSVTIPAGQSFAPFSLSLVENNRLDGTRMATITARVTNWSDGMATITINDNESTALALSVPASVTENISGSCMVSIGGVYPVSLVVSLLSSNPSRLSLPATVTIPAGSTSVTFYVTALNNSITDGTQSVTVSASASGLTGASGSINVLDDDAHNFSLSAVGSAQVAGVPFNVTVSAKDINDVPIPSYHGAVTLSLNGAGGSVPLTPTTTTLSSGSSTVSITPVGTGSNLVLVANDGVGHSGSSNSFNVIFGAFHHFAWNPIATHQFQNRPFSVTLTAQDVANNRVASFSGTALLSCAPPQSGTGTVVLNDLPLNCYYQTERTQCIYFPSEIGGAGKISALSFYVATTPGQALNQWTIRFKHTALSSYSTPSWDASGWTTVYQSNQTFSGTGWTTFVFPTPFQYDGTSNLMVDFSYSNSSGYTRSGVCYSTNTSAVRSIYYYTSSGYGDPLTWSGSSNPRPSLAVLLPNLKMQFQESVTMTPPFTGTFSGGTWSGEVSVQQPANRRILLASSGTATPSASNQFDVLSTQLSLTLPAAIEEGAPTLTGTVTLALAAEEDTVVSLSCSGSNRLTLPSSVTVLSGQNSATFPLDAPDNSATDGTQAFIIKASASTWTEGTASLSVIDNDVQHFGWSTIAGPQLQDRLFSATITALDVNGVVLHNYNGMLSLSGSGAAGSISLSPSTVGPLINGIWTGTLRATTLTTNAVLTANDGAGHSGQSNPFDVLANGDGITVNPGLDANSSGPQGGPFVPSSQVYTVTNCGTQSLDWTASNSQPWLTVSPADGTLSPGSSVNVTAGLNSGAEILATGAYKDTLSFTNSTSGAGNTARTMALVVFAANPVLSVSSPAGLTFTGTQGGPFIPASVSYILSNTGNAPLNWTANKTQSWLALSASNGALASGSSVTLTASINSSANSLATGAYADTVSFSNATNGNGSTSRPASLTVLIPHPVITSALNATAKLGVGFVYQTSASNSPTGYSASGLPAGLSMNPATGLISGTPTQTGSFNSTLGASNSSGTGWALLSINLPSVITWGSTGTMPASLCNVTALAAGWSHCLGLKADGTVVAWGGNNGLGQRDVPYGLDNVVAIACGDDHSLALRSDGTVVAWGDDSSGQTDVPYGLKNVVAIAGGDTHSLALKSDGTVAAWGANDYHQTSVPSYFHNVVTIAAGYRHSLAIRADGATIGWGDNSGGQTTVPTNPGGFTEVAGGSGHSLALKPDDKIAAWGDNSYGQTGVPTGLANVQAIACGYMHNLALKSDGMVVAWGGLGMYGESYVPPALNSVVAIAGGGSQSLALMGNDSPTSAPVIISPRAALGSLCPIKYRIVAKNNPTGYGANELPPGLSLNPTTGLISGTPTQTGSFSSNLTAANASGTTSATLTLILLPMAPEIISAWSATAPTGSAFSYQIAATNNPTSFSSSSLPPGLSLNPSTGLISGTPTQTGTFWPTIRATNAGGTSAGPMSMVFQLPPPAITSIPTVTGTQGAGFSCQILATNAPTSYDTTSLPSGLSVNSSTGMISGTATQAGIFYATVIAINAGGSSSAALTITILTPFDAWKSLHFTAAELSNAAISGDTACSSGDGISNLMKYALNLDPKADGLKGLPVATPISTGSGNFLSLTYRKVISASDIAYTAEVSGNLRTWDSGADYILQLSGTIDPGGVTQSIMVQDLTPMSGASQRFIRLKVTKP